MNSVNESSNLSQSISARLSLLGPLAIVVILALSLSLEWLAEPYPLKHVHWDAPIYFNQANRLNTEGVVSKIRQQAHSMYDCLMQGTYLCGKEGVGYWTFTRLGHILLVGVITGITGTDESSIAIVTGTYRLLFAIGLFFVTIFTVNLILLQCPQIPPKTVYVGAGISLILYSMSDIFSYMSGNPVSEVPAILLTAVSLWLLTKSWVNRSMGYAVSSGILAFVLFVVRMETIAVYLAFFVSTAVVLLVKRNHDKGVWLSLVIAGLAALTLFLVYSWIFYPLTDPRVVLAFASSAVEFHHPDHSIHPNFYFDRISTLTAANPMLWIGAIISLPLFRSRITVALGAVWLLLSIGAIGTDTEIRRMTPYILPLFLLSTIGYANLVRCAPVYRVRTVALVLMCSLLVLFSHPVTYGIIQTLPGMWRLQFVREFLASNRFERIDYHLPELVQLQNFLKQSGHPIAVIVSPKMQAADHYLIVQYLYSPSENELAGCDGSTPVCEENNAMKLNVHLSNAEVDDFRFVNALSTGTQVFLLGNTTEKEWTRRFGDMTPSFTTQHFFLMKLTLQDKVQIRPDSQ